MCSNCAHAILPCILAKVFNLILTYGYVPTYLNHSYTVHIQKVKDPRSEALTADNFRGIAISPIISKVLNIVSSIASKTFFIAMIISSDSNLEQNVAMLFILLGN
jgi:hypothetical protein